MSSQAELERDHLESVVSGLHDRAPELSLTVDPVEIRGYEYHTRLTFSIFAKGVRGELGRGGRYVFADTPGSGGGEMATGVTLFIDTVLHSLPKTSPAKRMFVPLGANREHVQKFADKGWVSIAELEPSQKPLVEASRLSCTHILRDGKLKKI